MADSARDDRSLAGVALGGLVAIALGVALAPLRESVSASNLAFAFLAWTIVIAETSGRAAALVTALVSALSLNFFLTRPYLSLHIHNLGDIGAFLGLAACGLIAALFGRRREASEASAGQAHDALAAVRRAERALEQEAPHSARLAAVVGELRTSLGLRAVVLRGPAGAVEAAAPAGFDPPDGAPALLEADSIVPRGDTPRLRVGPRGLRLPEAGGRLLLRHAGQPAGSLDLWEDAPAGLDTNQITALWVVARLLAVEVAVPARERR